FEPFRMVRVANAPLPWMEERRIAKGRFGVGRGMFAAELPRTWARALRCRRRRRRSAARRRPRRPLRSPGARWLEPPIASRASPPPARGTTVADAARHDGRGDERRPDMTDAE